jgi:hypothetical protein
MNTNDNDSSVRAVLVAALSALVLASGCKDDSPCDEGQTEVLGACYPAAAAGTTGAAGAGGTSAGGGSTSISESDAGGEGGAPAQVSAEVGQPCTDTAASSDCGGNAPVCAPLPAGAVCTQILCLEGEPNAGACPEGWPCTVIGANPSVCLNF